MTDGPFGTRCAQRAYLTVAPVADGPDTDVDPDLVTRGSGLTPTRVHRRGDPRGSRGVHRRSGWYLDVPARDEYDTDIVLRELLYLVEPHGPAFLETCGRLGLRAGVNVVVEMYAIRQGDAVVVTTPALSLPAETLRRLAALDLWLDVDQYVY